MAVSHEEITCELDPQRAVPWTLDKHREYVRVSGDSNYKKVRISGNMLLKFVRKAFTESDGTAVIDRLDITRFRSFNFPAFAYSGTGQHGD